MYSAILIEDRAERQKIQFGEHLERMGNFNFLNNISGGISFEEIQNKIENSEYSILDMYSVIMLHRSAFGTSVRNGLLEYFKKTSKKIIFFSGGISGCQITYLGELEIMLLNVKEFYSDNLILFLENGANNILELAFGNKWKLSNMIDAYDKLIIYTQNYKERPWARIEEDLKFSNWIKDFYFKNVEKNNLIAKNYLDEVLNKIEFDIKEAL